MLTTAQIGASGVLLIQYRLLRHGVDSAVMTTDDGIDLVAYSQRLQTALTIQVKTCLRPKPAGGRGKPTLDWWLPTTSPAQLIGLVNLESDAAWVMTLPEFETAAQQKPADRMHLYFYCDSEYVARPGCHARDFDPFKIEHRLADLF
jgi:hypothetical protein